MRLADDADLVGVGDRDVGLVIIEAGRPVEIVEDANPGPPRGAAHRDRAAAQPGLGGTAEAVRQLLRRPRRDRDREIALIAIIRLGVEVDARADTAGRGDVHHEGAGHGAGRRIGGGEDRLARRHRRRRSGKRQRGQGKDGKRFDHRLALTK